MQAFKKAKHSQEADAHSYSPHGLCESAGTNQNYDR